MALFAIVALRDSGPLIDTAIQQHFADTSYRIESGKWIVASEASTAKELSTLLGITTTWHIALPVGGYFGFAQSDMWEWIAAKRAKASG